MPGFSEECVSNAHSACANPDCRCGCHSHTQALERKASVQHSAPQPVLQTTCPLCGTKAAANENFCRRDGTRMQLGKCCLGCGAPGGNDDVFCWQCGLKCGEKPPEPEPEVPEQDRLVAIRQKALDLGLLKETNV